MNPWSHNYCSSFDSIRFLLFWQIQQKLHSYVNKYLSNQHIKSTKTGGGGGAVFTHLILRQLAFEEISKDFFCLKQSLILTMLHWKESEVEFSKPQAKTLQSEASWLKARMIALGSAGAKGLLIPHQMHKWTVHYWNLDSLIISPKVKNKHNKSL